VRSWRGVSPRRRATSKDTPAASGSGSVRGARDVKQNDDARSDVLLVGGTRVSEGTLLLGEAFERGLKRERVCVGYLSVSSR
jgi:hypothetical protein